AMALMLAGGQIDEEPPLESGEPVKPKIMGRLLEDDPAEKGAAAARHAAARNAAKEKSRELPPLEFADDRSDSKSKSRSKSKSNGVHNGTHRATPAEQAAAGMDPIEDLISQIMVHEPEPREHEIGRRPHAAAAPAARSSETPARRKPDTISPNVPLRELVLAWYEARGYRGSPASPAVWPIELVLRHRQDAARAYAFVVQTDHVSVDRITALIEQAREIGMMRVAVIAEAGYESGAKEVAKRRHVRLIDRSAMEAELSELKLPTAAKIIAVARKRSAAEPSPA
ncbi:MAG: hypothetical protein H7X91_00100, partial [Burkholderiales bacterium]|nr:hypothetical protein [Burkholderiales bacterium]